MGNTSSGLKKLRKSLRRISISRSKDHLDRSSQARRSTSLMNLSMFRKNVLQKKKSQSTTMIAESNRDEEVSKNESECENIFVTGQRGQTESDTNRQILPSNTDGSENGQEIRLNSKNTYVEAINEEIFQIDSPNEKSDVRTILDVTNSDYSSPRLEYSENIKKNIETNGTMPESPQTYIEHDCSGVTALKKIDETLHDIEQQIEQMPHNDLLVHLATFKDEIHRLWIKSYDVEASSNEVQPKKVNTIEYTKRLLHKLYNKAFKQHDYHVTETNM